MSCTNSIRRLPSLAVPAIPGAILIAVSVQCLTAHAGVAGDASSTPAEPSILSVILYAAIVYAIAIAISFATALLIKVLNVFLATRGGSDTEEA